MHYKTIEKHFQTVGSKLARWLEKATAREWRASARTTVGHGFVISYWYTQDGKGTFDVRVDRDGDQTVIVRSTLRVEGYPDEGVHKSGVPVRDLTQVETFVNKRMVLARRSPSPRSV